MTNQYEPMAPLSREWFENMLTMVDAEGRGIPGLTVEQGMAELEPHLPLIAGARSAQERVKEQETLAYARGQSDLRTSLSPGDRVGPSGEYVVVPVELVALVGELIESEGDSDHQTQWDKDAKRLLAALKEQDK